jgi:hypothetical protein
MLHVREKCRKEKEIVPTGNGESACVAGRGRVHQGERRSERERKRDRQTDRQTDRDRDRERGEGLNESERGREIVCVCVFMYDVLAAAGYIKENEDHFKSFLSLESLTFESYCRKIERTNAWGGQHELIALRFPQRAVHHP